MQCGVRTRLIIDSLLRKYSCSGTSDQVYTGCLLVRSARWEREKEGRCMPLWYLNPCHGTLTTPKQAWSAASVPAPSGRGQCFSLLHSVLSYSVTPIIESCHSPVISKAWKPPLQCSWVFLEYFYWDAPVFLEYRSFRLQYLWISPFTKSAELFSHPVPTGCP